MLDNTFTLEDFNVRHGEGPSDLIIKNATFASLDPTTNVIQTEFAPGTVVDVIPMTRLTVAANGTVTVAADPAQAGSSAGSFLIIGRGHELSFID